MNRLKATTVGVSADGRRACPPWLVGLWGGALLAAGASPAIHAAPMAVQVQSNGTILAPINALLRRLDAALPEVGGQVQYRFGMPTNAPVERSREEGMPVVHTAWRHGGILYRQSVLLTRLPSREAPPDAEPAGEPVLLVRLAGENEAPCYTNGSAALVVEVAGRALRLAFTNGVAYAIHGALRLPVAWVDMPAGGLIRGDDRGLVFEGNLPPGMSGAMTIKIPTAPLLTPAAEEALADLDFDEEVQRLKKVGQKAGTQDRLQLLLAP